MLWVNSCKIFITSFTISRRLFYLLRVHLAHVNATSYLSKILPLFLRAWIIPFAPLRRDSSSCDIQPSLVQLYYPSKLMEWNMCAIKISILYIILWLTFATEHICSKKHKYDMLLVQTNIHKVWINMNLMENINWKKYIKICIDPNP